MWGPSHFNPSRTSRLRVTFRQKETGSQKGDLGGAPRDTAMAGLPTIAAVIPPHPAKKQVFLLNYKTTHKGKNF